MTQQDIEKLVNEIVEKRLRNINVNTANVPRTLVEFAWQAAQTFGIPVVILGVAMLIAYQTLPGWVDANIQTQKSLTANLDKLTGNVDALNVYARDTEIFRKTVAVEHAMALDKITCVEKAVDEDSKRQQAISAAMVKTLENISASLINKEPVK